MRTDSTNLTVLDLFSGIGGFSYAAECLVGGFETVAFCEMDESCQKVLKKHWPTVPVFDDVCTLRAEDIRELCPNGLSLITAGFPCQDLSVAGKQAGYQGNRSALFYEIIRLARELRPDFLLLENVRNLLSHKGGETFQETLFQIAKARYDAEWAVIPASTVGACHHRERIWVVAYANDQRQSKQHIAVVTDKEGQLSWGNVERSLDPNWRRYVSKPVLCRGDDGLSGRVHRIKQLGNSIVPQVAAVPLRRIKELALQS